MIGITNASGGSGGGGGTSSNRNLLDNPWFTVNQRGQSSYTEYGYCLDRWRKNTTASSGDVIAVNDNGIFVTIVNASETGGHLLHFLETSVGDSLEGKTCTASVLLGNGTLVQGSAVYNSASDVVFINTSQFQVFARKSSSSNLHCLRIKFAATNGLQIRAVKLELGSTSTLANDEAPDYATELLRCQRYFWNYNATSGFSAVASIEPGAGATSSCYILVNTPTQMRANPVVTVDTYGNIFPQRSTVTALTFYSRVGNCITLHANTSSSQNMGMGFLNNTKFSLSADL